MSNPAETYESYMVPPLFAPCAQRLLDVAEPQPGERVLDVACGTGVVARHVARRVGSQGKVVGLDLNPNMLAVARATAGREGLSIDWREGRAEGLPFEDGSFDLVLCQFGLMFFADRPAAIAEMCRVLTSGGRVAVSVWQRLDRHPFYQDTAAIPAMQHLDATARQAMTATIREHMAGPLRAMTDGDHVVIPFHAHIARAHW